MEVPRTTFPVIQLLTQFFCKSIKLKLMFHDVKLCMIGDLLTFEENDYMSTCFQEGMDILVEFS